MFECNPVSRLPLSVYKNLEGVKNDILSRNPIFIKKNINEPPVSNGIFDKNK